MVDTFIRRPILASVCSLVLILAGGMTASAQEYQYIGVQGSWWNSDYAGEGFALEEYGDGFMIVFRSARRALQCAIRVQAALAGAR